MEQKQNKKILVVFISALQINHKKEWHPKSIKTKAINPAIYNECRLFSTAHHEHHIHYKIYSIQQNNINKTTEKPIRTVNPSATAQLTREIKQSGKKVH